LPRFAADLQFELEIVRHVSDAQLHFVKNKTDWNGTDVVFEISKNAGKTELGLKHLGLVRAFECYGDSHYATRQNSVIAMTW
jgi:hypothetical protein